LIEKSHLKEIKVDMKKLYSDDGWSYKEIENPTEQEQRLIEEQEKKRQEKEPKKKQEQAETISPEELIEGTLLHSMLTEVNTSFTFGLSKSSITPFPIAAVSAAIIAILLDSYTKDIYFYILGFLLITIAAFGVFFEIKYGKNILFVIIFAVLTLAQIPFLTEVAGGGRTDDVFTAPNVIYAILFGLYTIRANFIINRNRIFVLSKLTKPF
jgi:hypothetical protein